MGRSIFTGSPYRRANMVLAALATICGAGTGVLAGHNDDDLEKGMAIFGGNTDDDTQSSIDALNKATDSLLNTTYAKVAYVATTHPPTPPPTPRLRSSAPSTTPSKLPTIFPTPKTPAPTKWQVKIWDAPSLVPTLAPTPEKWQDLTDAPSHLPTAAPIGWGFQSNQTDASPFGVYSSAPTYEPTQMHTEYPTKSPTSGPTSTNPTSSPTTAIKFHHKKHFKPYQLKAQWEKDLSNSNAKLPWAAMGIKTEEQVNQEKEDKLKAREVIRSLPKDWTPNPTRYPTPFPTTGPPTLCPTAIPTMSQLLENDLLLALQRIANSTLNFTEVPSAVPTTAPTKATSVPTSSPTIAPSLAPTFNNKTLPAWMRKKYHVKTKSDFVNLFAKVKRELYAREANEHALKDKGPSALGGRQVPFVFHKHAQEKKYHMKLSPLEKMHKMIENAKWTAANGLRESPSEITETNKELSKIKQEQMAAEGGTKSAFEKFKELHEKARTALAEHRESP